MKTILAILLVSFCGFPAFASTDDPTDHSANNLVNLIYYAHPGQFLLSPTYSSTFHEASGSSIISQSQFTLGANYGLLIPGLRLGVSESTTNQSYNDGTYSYYYSGAGDPTFAVYYRLIDQLFDQFSADASAAFSPGVGTHTVATTGFPGSNYRGYSTLAAELDGYWTFLFNEFRLSGILTHDFVGNSSNEAYPGSSSTRDALWVKEIAVYDRVHFSPRVYIQGEADFDFSQAINYGYVNGASNTNQTPFHVAPTLTLGYLPYKQLLLTASVNYNSATNTLTNNVSGTLTQTNHETTSWALGARYEF